MTDNRIPIDEDAIAAGFADVFGDSIREPEHFNLGNPLTGQVQADLTEHPGMVWIHGASGVNTVMTGGQDNDSEDKQFVVRALLPRDRIPDGLAIYGCPVRVKQLNGIYEIEGLDGIRAAEYLHGLLDRLQRSVDISQVDSMLARPTSPPSGKIQITRSIVTFTNTAYLIPTIITAIDLIATYEPALTPGQAKAVKIELDPVTRTLFYEAGAAFVNTTHELAFTLYYPKTVTATRFLTCWVKIYESMQQIGITDILHAQEIINKGASGINGSILYDGNAPLYWRGKVITYP